MLGEQLYFKRRDAPHPGSDRHKVQKGKSLVYFKKLVTVPYDTYEFILLGPGEVVTQEMFLGFCLVS